MKKNSNDFDNYSYCSQQDSNLRLDGDESDTKKVPSISRMDTLMMTRVNVSSIANIPKSLVIPSCNLKLNETVGQGTYVYEI